MNFKVVKKVLLLSLLAVFMMGCSGDKEISEDKFSEYQELLKSYYEAYAAGDYEKSISYFNKGFEYEESGQKYVGEDVIKAAIMKNQHLKYSFAIRSMENTNGGILVTLDNSSYLLDISGVESYESQEFFSFKNDKIESVSTKINEDDYTYISKMIEAEPGIELEKNEDKIIISKIAEGSPASESALSAGAEILAIDGISVEDFELGVNEAVYRLAGMRDTSVKIKVLQDGQELEVEVSRYVK